MCCGCGPAQGLATGVVGAATAGRTACACAEPEAVAGHAQPTSTICCAAAPADGESATMTSDFWHALCWKFELQLISSMAPAASKPQPMAYVTLPVWACEPGWV